jgi:protein TonB
MKDKTLLLSGCIAVFLHGLVLLFDFGWQAATPATAAASIEVTLIAPSAQASVARTLGPPEPAAPKPVERPVSVSLPKPAPPEPTSEPVPPEPTPEPIPAPPPLQSPMPEYTVPDEFDHSVNAVARAPETVIEAGSEPGGLAQPLEGGGAFHNEAGDGGLASDVTAPVGYAYNPKPVYPMSARRRGWEGMVVLLVEVFSDGRIGRIEIESSSGHILLDEAAVNAVKRWRFEPATRNGQPVPTRARIPVEFSLRE